jgi:hypothetical protein
MKIKIEAIIEVDEDLWCSHTDREEFEWFKSLLDGKSKGPMVILWSNEVGDEIGSTSEFKYEIEKP